MQILQRARTTKAHFSIPYTTEQVLLMLDNAIKAEVELRGGEYSRDAEWRDILTKVASWMTGNGKQWLMFMGNVGDGKTTVMRAMQRVINAAEIEKMSGNTFGYVTMKFYTAKSIADSYANDQTSISPIIHQDIVGIDDIGAEPSEYAVYGNVLTPIADFMLEGYDRQTTCVFTTNLKGSEVRARYGARVADRLNEMVERIIFPQKSFRK